MNEYVECYENVMSIFNFVPPVLEEIYGYMNDIDMNTSSCIPGINSRVCKIMLDKIPSKFCHIFANSLFGAKFPESWMSPMVTLLPKDGDKTLPGNWRLISQTILFAKILEKIVHKRCYHTF